jgi:RNA polymerase sigma factor (sigma-70 family)
MGGHRGEALLNRSMLESVLRRVTPLAVDGQTGDAALLQRFAAERDERAFAVLIRRHGPMVWSVCRSLLPLEADAEDAFQATFLALVQAARGVRTPAVVGAWLHAVAYRAALKTRRASGRRRRREQTAAAAEATSPVAPSAWDELRSAVHEEVSLLPEALRSVFVMCELQGMAQQEAAASLGLKIGTLSGRLSKARQRLLARLARRGIPAGAAVAAALTGGASASSAPLALTTRALALARTGSDLTGVVSATVLELAREATEVSMTRTKWIIAATALVLLLAAGTASTTIPLAVGQPPAAAGPPGATAPALPAGSSEVPISPPRGTMGGPSAMAGAAGSARQWEYKFVPRKGDSLEAFQQLLNELGSAGWEFCGSESLAATTPAHRAEWGTNPTLVFKRPRSASRTMGMGPGGMGPPMGSGPAALGQPGLGRGTGIPGGIEPGIASGPGGSLSGAPGPTMSGFPPSGAPGAKGPQMPGQGAMTPGGFSPVGPSSAEHHAEVTVIRLKHVAASELSKTLAKVFERRNCGIVAEDRTNALLVLADDEVVKALKLLVDQLDVPATPARNARGDVPK